MDDPQNLNPSEKKWLLALARNTRAGYLNASDYEDEVSFLYRCLEQAYGRGALRISQLNGIEAIKAYTDGYKAGRNDAQTDGWRHD